jgi:hypothetical protein
MFWPTMHLRVRSDVNTDIQEPDYDLRPDGTYIVEFRMADGEALAISVPAGETRVFKHFPERMPFGLFVPHLKEP